ncbi:MAG: flagellar basal-body MS-ring/collar protein FliF [Lachnospiraceae bacterium]|nr:flagellar M-ring protein FliF [Lachnospiraceae bacterium]MDY3817895.1 flagellar basal-body MS-ring/collar protein FliF [Lachnospiraceae bacterium]
MPEQLQQIIDRIVEWWKKFNKKQQILLVSIVAVVVVAIGILAFVMTRPKTTELITCEDTAQSAEVKQLLDDNSITYQISDNGLTFTINQADEAVAQILLGSNDIPTNGYSISDALDGTFTTTEADKEKKYQLYLEEKLARTIEILNNVKSATVKLNIPEDDGTLAAKKLDAYANVMLELDGEMDEEQAASLAKFISTQLGNDTSDNIYIMDSNSNTLYSGGDESSVTGVASSQLTLKQKYEQAVKKEVKDVVIGTDVYSNVEVGLNLDMNFDTKDVVDREFYVADGMTQGYLDSESSYESNAVGGLAAAPGTDNNNDTTYMLENGDYTESSVTDIQKDYLPNERLTKIKGSAGTINYDTSSISVVATTYVTYDEDVLKKSGQLDDMTFEEFKSQNSARVKTEVDPDFYTMVSKATGFPEANISIVAYEVPFFTYSSGSGRTLADYFQILLAVLIFALLGYVVFRSTRKEQVEELEPELSVETLLRSTKESEGDMEDIGYKEKSEARMLIEKFVDEKPEAVASLLRNWLNEDWD